MDTPVVDTPVADHAGHARVGTHRRRGPLGRAGALVVEHRGFAVLFAVAALLRLATQLTYLPAVLYWDSYRYLENAFTLDPTTPAPLGYSLLVVRPVLELGDLTWLPAANHLLGLGAGALLYAGITRATGRRWLGLLASAPVLLDAYVLQIEQMVMSDALFLFLVALAFTILVWHRRPTPGAAALAGLVLGLTAVVRLVGAPLIVPAVLLVVFAGGSRARRTTAVALLVATFAVPVVALAASVRADTGSWALSTLGPRVLYARVAPFADCARVSEPVRFLCPPEPVGQRLTIDEYVWSPYSPANVHIAQVGEPAAGPALSRFGREVVGNQPGELVGHILGDFVKGFAWTRSTTPGDVPVDRWHFSESYLEWALAGPSPGTLDEAVAMFGGGERRMSPTLASLLRGYQLSIGWVPGTLLLGAFAVAVTGAVAGRRADRSLRAGAGMLALAGLGLLFAAAVYEFSWRYQLPALVLAPPAAALGFAALRPLRGQRRGDVAEDGTLLAGAPDEEPDDARDARVDAAALLDLHSHHGDVRLAPLCVLIAAYDEEDAIGDVLDAVPATVCGLEVSRLVVVDGAHDATAAVARSHGALVADCPENRGQGAALRLGYQIARDAGAHYIATLDADGQYDPSELVVVVQPLVDGEADFVTGSRRLGQEATTDGFRRAGVRVFARLVSLLTGQTITDTSNGLRAMRADVTGAVELRQPQYQASELLIGVLARGFRVVERPTTMRDRAAGVSKKGNNLLYGVRYGRVVLGTWWRERRRRPTS